MFKSKKFHIESHQIREVNLSENIFLRILHFCVLRNELKE